MTIRELRDSATNHRKSKQFKDAIAIYEQLWAENHDDCNDWDGWSYAFCLQNTQQYEKGIEIAKDTIEKYPQFSNTKNVYCWCLYYVKIKPQVNNEDDFIKSANEIVAHCVQEKYSPFAITVFKVANHINSKPAYNAEKIFEWISKLNPELLDDTAGNITEKDTGKERELASDKEKYYSLIINALFEKGEFEKCLQTCDLALSSFSKFHYDNDIWFKRKKAQCFLNTNELEKSLAIYEEILKRKSDWFIKHEIAELYLKMTNLDKSMKFACDAALSFGDADKKMKLYELLANLSIKKGEKDIAKKHIALVYTIRKEHEWNIEKMSNTITKFEVNITNLKDAKSQERELKKDWENLMFADKEVNVGVIHSLLPNGKAGFIRTTDKNSYYFDLRNFVGRKELAIPEKEVTFFLEDGFDTKKNQPTKIAINVRPKK
jgi:tetratricopeptide (TPR) repeat protein